MRQPKQVFKPIPEIPALQTFEHEMAIKEAYFADTLNPYLTCNAALTGLYDMLADVIAFEEKKGVTASTEKSKNRINAIIQHVEKLDKIASQNITMQLTARFAFQEAGKAKTETAALRKELTAIQQAWEQA